jgi:hypothetical protein
MLLNESFGWLWLLAGTVSGLLLGMRFQRDEWMGGYGSLRRRLVRLGHISFFGLGFLNILFGLERARVALSPSWLDAASWSLIVGGVTMPLCCALMAWRRAFQPAFAVPVMSLLLGVALTAFGMLRR